MGMRSRGHSVQARQIFIAQCIGKVHIHVFAQRNQISIQLTYYVLL